MYTKNELLNDLQTATNERVNSVHINSFVNRMCDIMTDSARKTLGTYKPNTCKNKSDKQSKPWLENFPPF